MRTEESLRSVTKFAYNVCMQKKVVPAAVKDKHVTQKGGRKGGASLPKGDMMPFGSDEAIRILVENLNEVLFTLDEQGRFIYISPVIEQITKVSMNGSSKAT